MCSHVTLLSYRMKAQTHKYACVSAGVMEVFWDEREGEEEQGRGRERGREEKGRGV